MMFFGRENELILHFCSKVLKETKLFKYINEKEQKKAVKEIQKLQPTPLSSWCHQV